MSPICMWDCGLQDICYSGLVFGFFRFQILYDISAISSVVSGMAFSYFYHGVLWSANRQRARLFTHWLVRWHHSLTTQWCCNIKAVPEYTFLWSSTNVPKEVFIPCNIHRWVRMKGADNTGAVSALLNTWLMYTVLEILSSQKNLLSFIEVRKASQLGGI
jgi:hypothetical protein